MNIEIPLIDLIITFAVAGIVSGLAGAYIHRTLHCESKRERVERELVEKLPITFGEQAS